MLKRLIVLVLFVFSTKAYALNSDLQSWNLLTALIGLDQEKKFSLYLEAQPRFGDDVSHIERLLLRSALVYNYSSNLSFYAGYGWTPTFMNPDFDYQYRDESRLWQQVLYSHDLFGLKWQHRGRLEQRFIEKHDNVANRFRYLLRGSLPIAEDQSYGLTGYNEFFVNLNSSDPNPTSGYDRNRFFFGPYLKSGIVRYELGYLGEHARRFGAEQRYINAILLSAGISF